MEAWPLPVRAWSKLFATAMGGDPEYFRENDPFALAAKNADAPAAIRSSRSGCFASRMWSIR